MEIYFGVVITVTEQQKYLCQIPMPQHQFVFVMGRFIQNVIAIGIIKDCIGIESQQKKEKDIESLEVVDNKELAKYLRKEMQTQGYVNTVFHLIKVPTEDELAFWIQQFKTRKCDGHSEWSERYQCNMWVDDNE